jgi:arylsulfatase A-like enzyme
MPGVRDAEYVRAQYRASVAYLDAQLQRLFAVPRVREGIVAFTADHGESLGGHGIFWDHQGLYPDTVHVPLILVTPGVTPGTRSSRPVRQIDVGRTLLDLAGLPAAAFPGRNLLDQAPAEQSRVLIAAHERQAAIQDGPWHLILHLVESANPPHARHSVELFHLEADPGCRNDLAQEQRTVASRLRADLLRELAAVSGPGLAGDADLSPETLGQLAALGYVGTDETGARGDLIGCTCEECTRF